MFKHKLYKALCEAGHLDEKDRYWDPFMKFCNGALTSLSGLSRLSWEIEETITEESGKDGHKNQ